jgi:aminoglycoside phosphotransferase family enzyme
MEYKYVQDQKNNFISDGHYDLWKPAITLEANNTFLSDCINVHA